MRTFIPLFIALIPLVIFLIQSSKESGNANSLKKFFQYGEGLSSKSFFTAIAASNSSLTASIYLIAVYGYFYGFGIFIWVMSFWILTQYASSFTIKRVEEITKTKGGFLSKSGTLHEFLQLIFYSKRIRILTGIFSFLVYIGLLSCELMLGLEVIQGVWPKEYTVGIPSSNLHPWFCLILMIISVVIYASVSGFRGVIRTDKFQLFLMCLMLLATWIIVFPKFPEMFASYSKYYSLNPLEVLFNPSGEGYFNFIFLFLITNLIFWGFWWPSAMDQWHRCAATQAEKSALDSKFGTTGFVTTLYLAVMSLTAILIGVFVKIFITSSSGESGIIYNFLFWFEHDSSIMTGVLVGLISAGLIAAIVSTVDTYLIVACQSIVLDVFMASKISLSLFEADKNKNYSLYYLSKSRKFIYLSFFLVLTFMGLVSLALDIYTMIYGFFSLMLALIPALTIALISGRNKTFELPAFYSILCSGCWAIFSGAYIVYAVNIQSNSSDTTEIYTFLYLNSIFTLSVGYLVFYVVKVCSYFKK